MIDSSQSHINNYFKQLSFKRQSIQKKLTLLSYPKFGLIRLLPDLLFLFDR